MSLVRGDDFITLVMEPGKSKAETPQLRVMDESNDLNMKEFI